MSWLIITHHTFRAIYASAEEGTKFSFFPLAFRAHFGSETFRFFALRSSLYEILIFFSAPAASPGSVVRKKRLTESEKFHFGNRRHEADGNRRRKKCWSWKFWLIMFDCVESRCRSWQPPADLNVSVRSLKIFMANFSAEHGREMKNRQMIIKLWWKKFSYLASPKQCVHLIVIAIAQQRENAIEYFNKGETGNFRSLPSTVDAQRRTW